MAPTAQIAKKKEKFTGKGGDWKKSKNKPAGVKKKRKWVPEHKVFDGSVKEGQGFAFKRKQKVQFEYKKLLRKEKRKNPESQTLYKDEYPEHLRHLYMAEAEKLKKEAWLNRVNRSKVRMRGHEEEEEEEEEEEQAEDRAADDAADPAEDAGGAEQAGNPEGTAAQEAESLPMSNRMKKKMMKKTSHQKSKEEYEMIREKRRKKKEEYLMNKQQREEALERYKAKKRETFQMLSKKTKKGQPNLNLQMEYLLQKIQGAPK
ncbi:thyroid transcription factor 1-associated protein 26 homolog [Myripristis murdjan]|uniref:Coiled-coil domain containing 59 n=1 Tax=Myripristis murdjan TaxID=586833 RepID=A0A668A573_9TELE|nr:thyroid transcription factor 1-associated protein 26 [Myripristis murdjan]